MTTDWEGGKGGDQGYRVGSSPLSLFHACLAHRHSAACTPLRDLKGFMSLATGSASPPLLLCGQTQALTCPSPASDYNPNLTLARIPERTPQPCGSFCCSEHRELCLQTSSCRFSFFMGFFTQPGPEIRNYVKSKRRDPTN